MGSLKAGYDATQQKTQESLGKGVREKQTQARLVLDERHIEDDFHHVSDSDDSVEVDRPVAVDCESCGEAGAVQAPGLADGMFRS